MKLSQNETKPELYNDTCLMHSVEHDDVEVLEWAIQEEFDINKADEYSNNPLTVAVEHNGIQCICFLLKNYANSARAVHVASNIEIQSGHQ